MTFQPPPPPPGGTPPPPPPSGQPGQWGPPPGGGYPPAGGAGFDPKTVNPLDWAALGAGVLVFIFSFISYYTVDVSTSGCPSSVSAAEDNVDLPSFSAWHGFFGWFGTFLALVGAGLIAMALFAPHIKLPVPARLAALGAFALAALSTLLALFITPGDDYSGTSGLGSLGSCKIDVSVGHGLGYWVSLILVIAGLVATLMRFQQTGGQLPGGMSSKVPNIGQHGPQGGLGTGPQPGPGNPQPGPGTTPPPPPPGYGPPQ
jgi:hypothetical protein